MERGDLLRAEKCFIRASQLAPHEDYIVRHLKIVQQRITKLTTVVNQNAPTRSVMQKSQNEFHDNFVEATESTTSESSNDQNGNTVDFEYSAENNSNKNYLGNNDKAFP